jgi:hypothetical protein
LIYESERSFLQKYFGILEHGLVCLFAFVCLPIHPFILPSTYWSIDLSFLFLYAFSLPASKDLSCHYVRQTRGKEQMLVTAKQTNKQTKNLPQNND